MNARLMDAVAVSYFLGPFVRNGSEETQNRTDYAQNSLLSEAEVEQLYGNPFRMKAAAAEKAVVANTPRRPTLSAPAGAGSR